MSWDQVVLQDVSDRPHLGSAIDELFAQQRRTWPMFQAGEASLESLVTQRYDDADDAVVIQANPGRQRSTNARVDPQSIAARPCFLCSQNMPPEERGLAWEDWVIVPNPFPVLARHCTIPAREHRPQRLREQLPTMLRLAQRLGPDMLVFYNGPRCGASAPDHLHLQACQADQVPLWSRLRRLPVPYCAPRSTWGRAVLEAADADGGAVVEAVTDLIDVVERLLPQAEFPEEPPLNVLAGFADGAYRCAAFPRAAHRPAAFFLPEPERLAVSPAALEMAGVLVAPAPEDLPRLDRATVRALYGEVSLDAERWQFLLRDRAT